MIMKRKDLRAGALDLESLRLHFQGLPGVTEEFPFGPTAMVFKVLGKMFAIVGWQNSPLSISLKCNPDDAQVLRASYAAIKPGYHLNKEHWNTVVLDGEVPDALVLELIEDSYALVAKSLKKAERERLSLMRKNSRVPSPAPSAPSPMPMADGNKAKT
jgi:predicted DNA-binding protein (MmcQ/YjbR family)